MGCGGGGGYKHPLLAASSQPFPPLTSPKVAHKGDLSCTASAPPLSPPGCPPRQSIPCQENERTPVLNGTLCVHGAAKGPHSGQKRVSTASMAQPSQTSPPPPPPSPFPALLFFAVAPSYGERSELKTAEGAKNTEPSAAARDALTSERRHVGRLAYLTDHATHTLTPPPSPAHTPIHSLSPLLYSTPPPTYLPPTCQTLLDIQKRKQETCGLPGKCCLHILRLKNYASQQKQETIEASGEGKTNTPPKKYKKRELEDPSQ